MDSVIYGNYRLLKRHPFIKKETVCKNWGFLLTNGEHHNVLLLSLFLFNILAPSAFTERVFYVMNVNGEMI